MNKTLIKWIIVPGFVIALGAAASLTRPAQGAHRAAESRLLQIVLLVGMKEGTSEPQHIPENTASALKDIETFLPYRSYQHIDTSLIRTNGDARGELKGIGDRDYHFNISFNTESGKDGDRLAFRVFRIGENPVVPRPPGGKGDPQAAPRAPRDVISTSFTVDVGETIVVGTSKLDGGDRALLVLLTVIP